MSSDATERLRELLDERGVKWGETRDGATAFSDESGHVRWAIACGAAKCFFEVGPLTPEQAIAATLGNDGAERSNDGVERSSDGVDVTCVPDDYTAKLMAELVQVMEERDTLRSKFKMSQSMRHAEYERYTKENAELRELVSFVLRFETMTDGCGDTCPYVCQNCKNECYFRKVAGELGIEVDE